MVYEIRNSRLCVRIRSLGAELISVKDEGGGEYIYQPGPRWEGQAKNLFPNVGLAKGDYTIIRGQQYPMYQHGFLKDREMMVTEQRGDRITFVLHSDSGTRVYLPYRFTVSVAFALMDHQLIQTYSVMNEEETPMYFGIGAHTGFSAASGSYVDFMGNDRVVELCRRDMKYMTGERRAYLKSGTRLPLSPEHYRDGAHILEGFNEPVIRLVNPKLRSVIQLDFKEFDRITLWSIPKADEVLCMMPWCALPDEEYTDHVFEHKAGNICLAGHSEHVVSQIITFMRT